jgi:hypothetical protein
MSISMYQTSVPVFLHGLGTLTHILRKGEAHALETGADPASYVEARLAPDMMTLIGQIQRASDTSKFALERLSGVASPKMEDNEKAFAELLSRVERTADYIGSIPETQLDGTDTKRIELKLRDFNPVFTGASYLLTFAVPNFYFHVTTAYDILRHRGVPLAKLDYLRLKG